MSRDFYVIGIDVISYSEKDLPTQVYAQDLLDRNLDAALKEHTALQEPIWIDGGDGGYLLLTGDTKEIVNFIETFLIRLANDNKNLREESCALVRCAVHYDAIDIRKGRLGQKYTGNAINVCARLLAGMRRNPNQVVCSARFRKLLTDFDDHRENITRLPDVVDKHGKSHPMYNLQRNKLGVVPSALESHHDALERFDESDIPG